MVIVQFTLCKSAIIICQLFLLVLYLLETSYDVAQCYTVQEALRSTQGKLAREAENCYVAG